MASLGAGEEPAPRVQVPWNERLLRDKDVLGHAANVQVRLGVERRRASTVEAVSRRFQRDWRRHQRQVRRSV